MIIGLEELEHKIKIKKKVFILSLNNLLVYSSTRDSWLYTYKDIE